MFSDELKKEVKKAFWEEYLKAEHESDRFGTFALGVMGGIMGAALLGGVIAATGGTALLVVGHMAVGGALFAAMSAAVANREAQEEAVNRAQKKMEQDIENGVLFKRYEKEILPRIEPGKAAEKSLLAAIEAKTNFGKAAAPSEEAPKSSPKSTVEPPRP
jgi:hypothetical protein